MHYAGVDAKSGSGQDQLGSDGVGDTTYVIDADNYDSYPLMTPIRMFNAGTWNGAPYYVDISSNSTISNFSFSQAERRISFNVTGANNTLGVCRVVIPKPLLWVENGWIVFVGWTQIGPWVTEDTDNAYLYFMYSHSAKEVQIIGTNVIPEFPSFFIPPIFMTATLLAVIAYRRKHTT